jgi:hypothetical protein
MADDPRDTRDRKRTPVQHRDHGLERERASRQMPALQREEQRDAIPRQVESEHTPLGMTAPDEALWRAKQAERAAALANIEVGAVRREMLGNVGRIDGRVDGLAEDVADVRVEQGTTGAKVEVLAGVVTKQLEVGLKGADAEIEERKASNAWRRETWGKIIIAVLGLLAAIQAAYLVAK